MTAEALTDWKPLDDRLVVELEEAETESKGGVILPGQAQHQMPVGTVVAVGPGHYDIATDKFGSVGVKVGDVVQFATFAGTEIKLGERELLILREADIFLVKS